MSLIYVTSIYEAASCSVDHFKHSLSRRWKNFV